MCSSSPETYRVQISGIADKSLEGLFLKKTSAYALKAQPTSISRLKERAQDEIQELTTLAHYFGYYSAKISYSFTATPHMALVYNVELGPKYTLNTLTITPATPDAKQALDALDLKFPGQASQIDTQKLLEFERTLIHALKQKGYASCYIVDKEIVADAKAHSLSVRFTVESGPKMHLAKPIIIGNQEISTETIRKYLYFQEGELYNPDTLEKSELALEKTGLFSSVILTQEVTSDNLVQVQINVQEAKYRSIGAGVSYTTTWGPGISAEWENRNFRAESERLSFKAELWKRYQTITCSLIQPRLKNSDHDLVWLLEYSKLRTLAFDSLSYSFSRIAQRQITPKIQFDLGWRLEWLDAVNYASHKTYYLIKLPIQLKISNADNFLDPTVGQTLNVKFTPTTQLLGSHFVYGSQMTSLSSYHTTDDRFCTLATKLVFANIIGATRQTIPPSDRIYGGSENVLRGYRAYTVSPLHNDKIPIGGRSLIAASLEARLRTVGALGWAFFYDVGNVYSTALPSQFRTFLQSVGTGLRYNTPIGPLRFDVAIPLNRRAQIDPYYQIFFSIGQSF